LTCVLLGDHGQALSQQVTPAESSSKLEGRQMRQREIADFEFLTTRLSELIRQLTKRESITIEKTPDALDEVHIGTERELATRNLERESNVLRAVRAALTRIEEAKFGHCLNCEEEISPKRLRAVPWTPLCPACKEQEDRNAFRGLVRPDRLSSRAA
jgi:DnaK suppressor protein